MENQTTSDKEDHGYDQAMAQYETICEQVDALESDDVDTQEQARTDIQENALSVEMRSDWVNAGDVSALALSLSEFRIVLCAGGPHVQIRGELDSYGQPRRAWLEYQDWATPMTQFFDASQSVLLTYASQFYFSE